MLEISDKETPVLHAQTPATQELAKKFAASYHGGTGLKTRTQWGSILRQIKSGMIVPQDATATSSWSAICRELNIARGTADDLIDLATVTEQFSEAVREEADKVGFNLAGDGVLEAYQKGKYAQNSDPVYARGIVSKLKEETKKTPKPGRSKLSIFVEDLAAAYAYAAKNKLTAQQICAGTSQALGKTFGLTDGAAELFSQNMTAGVGHAIEMTVQKREKEALGAAA